MSQGYIQLQESQVKSIFSWAQGWPIHLGQCLELVILILLGSSKNVILLSFKIRRERDYTEYEYTTMNLVWIVFVFIPMKFWNSILSFK